MAGVLSFALDLADGRATDGQVKRVPKARLGDAGARIVRLHGRP
jgi:hypothetical protein